MCGWGCYVSKQDLHCHPDQQSPFCASCTPAAPPWWGPGHPQWGLCLPLVLSVQCSRASSGISVPGMQQGLIPAQSPAGSHFKAPAQLIRRESWHAGDLPGPGTTNRGEEMAPASCTLCPLDLRTGCTWNRGTKTLLHLLTMIHQKSQAPLGCAIYPGRPQPRPQLPSIQGPSCLGSISAQIRGRETSPWVM